MSIFGDLNKKLLDKHKPIVDRINSLENEYSDLTNDALKLEISVIRDKVKDEISKTKNKEDVLNKYLEQVYAIVRETSKRVLGMRHFDVQIYAGIFLHKGYITEMKTGEGKTLVATLPAFLNSLAGDGVHIVTVNDYLAKRDAEWMGKIYKFLNASVAYIGHEESMKLDYVTDQDGNLHLQMVPISRKEAYLCDIVYGTNNEFGFDYLRDNMVIDLDDRVQRGLDYAIVDEVDSILIDEARTPLIISSQAEQSTEKYYQFANIVKQLKENEDYVIDEKQKSAILTDNGLKRVEEMLNIKNLYTDERIDLVHHLEEALKAQSLFLRDRDYVVKDGEIIIVDEFTGRLMPGRRYSEGLHQAIEAKEGVEIKNESMTLATITLQNYFRMYRKLAGMTGTAVTEAEEFSKIYKLETVVIPTNKKMIRKDYEDEIYKDEKSKFNAVVNKIKEKYENGQPVLVGTVSIEKNEQLHKLLEKVQIPHNVLNAKNHEREAEIIAQAGRLHAVTIATNMAGRGVDIMLGGNPQIKEEAEKVKELGGLFVIGTERHESRRIDNQLRGRSGRQGDPGESQFYLSMEDDLMRIFGSERIKNMMNAMGLPDDMPIKNKMITRSIESAQKRVEGYNFDIRKHLVEYDDVINNHRNIIYKKREEILENKDNSKEIVLGFIKDEIEKIVNINTSEDNVNLWNIDNILINIRNMFNAPDDISSNINNIIQDKQVHDLNQKKQSIIDYIFDLASKSYDLLEKDISPDILR
ncbi:MAG TPA: preprotein translocase subunit SecA, partial [bacterium]|nr:preprotein translocase subunit SecA [bacterium]